MLGFLKRSKPQDFSAQVRPAGAVVEVKAGDNLLKAALDAGLPWPHDCRVGSCGTCRCTLKEGDIKPLSDFSYVLDGDQLDAGMILACQSTLRSDVVVEVELDDAEHHVEVTSHTGSIRRLTPLTDDILEVVIKVDDEFPRSAVAGQYAEVGIPSLDKPRSYSFAKAPQNEGNGEITFFVRLVPGGEFTEWLFAEDRTGEAVTVTGPYGHFWLRKGDGPVLCVAGGSGMSSIKAVLEDACDKQIARDVFYLFGARTQKDLYCLDEMQDLQRRWNAQANFTFIPVLSEEPTESGWDGARGLVTDFLKQHCNDNGLDLASSQAYLCGPPPMVDAAVDFFKSEGLGDDEIFFDKFLDASTMPGGR